MLGRSATTAVLRIAGNTMSVLTSDVLNRATTFLIYAMVSRYLDARAFGQLSVALALLYTFQVFAVLGLPVLVTREVAKDKKATAAYLASGSLLSLTGSLVSLLALGVFLRWMNYEADTAAIILTTGCALVPYTLSAVFESIFRGWERMHYIACANVPVNLGKIALSYSLLERGAGLWEITLVLVGSHFAVVAIEAGIMIACVCRGGWKTDLRFAKGLAWAAVPFFGIDSLLAISSSLNVILVSDMVDVASVGQYNAAAQLLVPLVLFTQSVTACVFPLLCRKFDGQNGTSAASRPGLQQIMDRMIQVLLAVAVPGALALFCLADSVLVFVYGKQEFAQAAILLQIMVPIIVLKALTGALGNVLLAGLKEKVTLRIAAVDTVAALVFGAVLIHQFGVVGAAVAALLTRIVDFLQHYAPVKRLVSQVALGKLAWPCVVASLAMAGVLVWVKMLGLIPAAGVGAVVYLAVLALLLPWTHSGPWQAIARNP